MQVDVGNNKIHTNFSSIVTNKQIEELNRELKEQQEDKKVKKKDSSASKYRQTESESPHRNHRRHSKASSDRSSSTRHQSHNPPGASSRKKSSVSEQNLHSNFSQNENLVKQSAIIPTSDNNLPTTNFHYPPPTLLANQNISTPMSNSNRHVGKTNGNGGAEVAAMNGNGANKNHSKHEEDLGAEEGSGEKKNNDRPAGKVPPKLAQTKVQVGMFLKNWLVIERIGAGSFGETFTAVEVENAPTSQEDDIRVTPEGEALLANLPPPEERREVCIKVEQENKNVLRLEALALKKVQSCQQVVRYYASGCTHGMNFLVMEKLGPNLAELRRRSPHGTFNIYTTLKAGISCLKAIRGVHEQGLVHRDIKPSNFVTGLPNSGNETTCYIIDFGLARRFQRSNGEIRPPRDNAGFRGTSRYASVASHHHIELGRVDDIWSLLFMLVEFATGTLPWRKFKEKEDIGKCKEESINPHLVRNLPREFQPFLAHLQTLTYEDEPNYDLLIGLMNRAIERRGYPEDKPVDWQLDPETLAREEEALWAAAREKVKQNNNENGNVNDENNEHQENNDNNNNNRADGGGDSSRNNGNKNKPQRTPPPAPHVDEGEGDDSENRPLGDKFNRYSPAGVKSGELSHSQQPINGNFNLASPEHPNEGQGNMMPENSYTPGVQASSGSGDVDVEEEGLSPKDKDASSTKKTKGNAVEPLEQSKLKPEKHDPTSKPTPITTGSRKPSIDTSKEASKPLDNELRPKKKAKSKCNCTLM